MTDAQQSRTLPEGRSVEAGAILRMAVAAATSAENDVKKVQVVCNVCRKERPSLFGSPTQADGCCAWLDREGWLLGGYGSPICDNDIAGYWRVDPSLQPHLRSVSDVGDAKTTTSANADLRQATKEMVLGSDCICDDCIERWIDKGWVYCFPAARTCSRCHHRPASYRDFLKRTILSLDGVPIYRSGESIRRIDDADVAAFKAQARKDTELWICHACIATQVQHKIFVTACTECKKTFETKSNGNADDCCTIVRLAQVADHVTLGEARKLCDRLLCDACVTSLVEQGILV